MNWDARDWEHLIKAHADGGICVVQSDPVRDSLKRAGLMEAAPRVRNRYGYMHPKMMRLTKAGQRRAADLWEQFAGRNGRDARNLRKDRNRLIHRNRSERRHAPMLWMSVWV